MDGGTMKTTKTLMIVSLILVAASAWSAQPVNESHPVPRGGEVDIESIAGTLTITGWDASEVRIEGTLGDGVEELEVHVDDDGVSIEVEYDEEYHGKQTTATNLTIMMPTDSPLSVETVSASISVTGVMAEVDLESVSGKIYVADRPSGLDVENVSGSITVENAPHDSDIASVSGTIKVISAAGGMDAENVSGSILIEGGSLAGGDFETVSGNITCKAIPGPTGDIDMETMSGTITLVVDADMAASYDLATFSGSINNQFGPEAKKTSRYTPEKELSFNTGTGGPRISLNSFSGTIKLLTR
jgi:DUF4097 and DUF4098 domain-containing protein YvlB